MTDTAPYLARTLLALATITLVGPSAAVAQRLSLAPTIGLYAPTGNLVQGIINGGETLSFRQELGLALGGRLGLSFGRHLGITATGSYVPKSLRATVTQSGVSQNPDEYTNLWFGTGRVHVWLLPPTGILALGVNGGVGVVGRGETVVTDDAGTAYTEPARTDIGGVAGGTVGLNLGVIGLFVSVDDYIYRPAVFEALGIKPRTQNDLQFSFGLGSRF